MASVLLSYHNATVLNELNVGDLVEFPRTVYSHWGVYIGDRKIVHLTGVGNGGSKDALTSGNNFDKACVRIDDFVKVAEGCNAKRNNDKDNKYTPLNPHEIVQRAMAMAMDGTTGYNLLYNNCEHLAAYLRYDVKLSEQVNRLAEGTVCAGAAVVIGGLAAGGLAYAFFRRRRSNMQ